MIEGLKPLYNNLLRPLVRPLVKCGIHPNHLTILGVILFAIAAVLTLKGLWYSALGLVVAGSLLDGLDGVLARESNQKSVFGGILDSCADRITEIVLLLGVLGYFLSSSILSFSKNSLSLHERAWGIVLCYTAITLSLMVSYIKARCEGAGVACSRGILQRPERLILFCLGLLAGARSMIWVLGIVSMLGVITVIQRFWEAYSRTKSI